MPFRSESQRRWAYANEPEMARRWEKKTKGDLPERVGKLTERAYIHAFYRATAEQRAVLHAARMVAKARMGLPQDEIDKAGPLPYLEPMQKALPMHGKADDVLDEVPWEVKRMMSQLPLEIQATEIGGAGSTDIRPTMDQMNYENPSRNAGDCAGCDHASEIPGQYALTCVALQGEPAVTRRSSSDVPKRSSAPSMSANSGSASKLPAPV